MATRIFLLFFLLLTAFTSQGQITEAFISAIKSHSHDPAGIKKTIQKLAGNNSIEIFSRQERHNYFELQRNSFSVRVKNTTGDSIRESYYITWYEHSGRVVFFDFTKRNEKDQSYEDILKEIDTVFINEYNSRHKTSFRDLDFFSHSVYDNYGIAWGLRRISAPGVYKPMEDVFRMVENRDVDSLKILCFSLCNESRAYGATGLYLLDKMQTIHDACLIDLFKEIRASGIKINFAPGGCVIYGDTSIEESLTDDFLAEVYESFQVYKAKK